MYFNVVVNKLFYNLKRKELFIFIINHILEFNVNAKPIIEINFKYKGIGKATLLNQRPVFVHNEDDPETRDLIAQLFDNDKICFPPCRNLPYKTCRAIAHMSTL